MDCFVARSRDDKLVSFSKGLSAAAERKNGWQLAEYAGDPAPWRMQALLGRTLWDQEKARDICRDYVIEHLGDQSGVLVLDETGFLKKGNHSAGVARQYSGTAGGSRTVRSAFFAAMPDRPPSLSTEGLDRGRGTPEDGQHSRRGDLRHQTEDRHRHAGGGANAGVPCAWVLGDSVYGSDKSLRVMLESRDKPYVLSIRGNERLTTGDFRTHTAEDLAAGLSGDQWRRLPAGEGSKGPRLYDWARLRLFRLQSPPWDHWLLIRRSTPIRMTWPST